MRGVLYLRLAGDGIRKNRKMYLPFILTSSMMAAIFYIITFLSESDYVSSMRGGDSTGLMLMLGSRVISVFSVVFLFYTNAFLIKKRKKEFGLLNVLGMNKNNLGRILFYETMIACLISLAAGLFFGVLISKLAEMMLCRLMNAPVDYTFRVFLPVIGQTCILFVIIFLMIWLNGLRQIYFSSAISLVRSENAGEKPVKGNWVLGLMGLVILVCAYYLAISIEQPLSALLYFFVAVLMVIAATYLLFIAGSVTMCRILMKNKNYYYQSRHFVSVSSMAYRMKRNGAGLASICILLTMVLVMISSSSCLYFGEEGAVEARYPREICVTSYRQGYHPDEDEKLSMELKTLADLAVKDSGLKMTERSTYKEYTISGYLEKGEVIIDPDALNSLAFVDYEKIAVVHLIGLSDYNRIHGRDESLAGGQILLCGVKTKWLSDELKIGELTFHAAKKPDPRDVKLDGVNEGSAMAGLFLVVNDEELSDAASYLSGFMDSEGNCALELVGHDMFDISASYEEQVLVKEKIREGISQSSFMSGLGHEVRNYTSCREEERIDFYGTFGGLFFIGILLSVIFLFSAALIIYYKQVTEGYEDRSRFEIMQKVGMTKGDIRRSIDSQMFTVFLLPITFAILHLCFAFPMVLRMLVLFSICNTLLLIKTAAISALCCVIFYVVTYRLTSNAYYAIVSGE